MGVPINPSVGEVRWYRVGKILQDLLLKFALWPVALATWAMVRVRRPLPLRTLLVPWFAVGLALALVAVLSPFPLRFEYFLLPAVAAAAGLGAARLTARRRVAPAVLTAGWTAAFALQAVLGLLLLQDRFEIIAVIMESPRWPFPFR
jgi:hypothetical protein